MAPGDRRDHLAHARLVGHVQRMRLAAGLARDGLRGRAVDVGHRDMGAGLGQRVAGRAADAVAAAGHQRDPAGQAQHSQVVAHQPTPAARCVAA